MFDRKTLTDLFDYTDFCWATYRTSVHSLPDGALTKPVEGSGWPALVDAFRHIVTGYDGWLPGRFVADPVVVEDIATVTAWEQIDDWRAKTRAMARALLDSTPDETLFERTTKVLDVGPESQLMSVSDILTHLLLHERGHHGDLTTLIDRLGGQAPANDYIVYLYFKERRG